MRQFKIAIVNEVWTAGATRCARDLERHLSSRHQVRYYPRNGKETVQSILEDLFTFAPDVVHCHSYYGDLPYQFLARVSHLYPTCFTPHDSRPIGTMQLACWECSHATTCIQCPLVSRRHRYIPVLNPYFRQRLHKRYVHWQAANTLTLITPSNWLKQRLAKTELKRFSINHIPNGIDLAHYYPVSNARMRLGLPEENNIILHVAHTSHGWYSNPRKGLNYLADAFVQQVVPKYSDAILLVAGEGLVPNHPNVKPVGFLPQEDLPLYYSAANVFAAPTLADNLPYTIIEAMACGTPVVASKVGGVAEEIEEGITGHLVPPANSEALGLALVSILENKEKQQQMGRASRVKAESLFGMDRFIHSHEKLYQQVAKQSRNASNSVYEATPSRKNPEWIKVIARHLSLDQEQ